MPEIENGESTLFFEVHGSGRPLVFLHGMGGNTLVWWQQVAFFAQRYRCILVDQRGWGRSEGSLPERWVDAFVPDLEVILDELDVEEFAVIAQSMGGWTANAFCRAYPKRIRVAVMTGTTGGYVPPKLRSLYQKARVRADEMRSLWKSGDGPHQALGSRIYREQPALAYLYEALSRLNRSSSPNTETGLSLETENNLCLPEHVLFIYGDEDIVCPKEVVEAAAAEAAGSTTCCIPQCGHSVYFERADTFNQEVYGFLKLRYE